MSKKFIERMVNGDSSETAYTLTHDVFGKSPSVVAELARALYLRNKEKISGLISKQKRDAPINYIKLVVKGEDPYETFVLLNTNELWGRGDRERHRLSEKYEKKMAPRIKEYKQELREKKEAELEKKKKEKQRKLLGAMRDKKPSRSDILGIMVEAMNVARIEGDIKLVGRLALDYAKMDGMMIKEGSTEVYQTMPAITLNGKELEFRIGQDLPKTEKERILAVRNAMSIEAFNESNQ